MYICMYVYICAYIYRSTLQLHLVKYFFQNFKKIPFYIIRILVKRKKCLLLSLKNSNENSLNEPKYLIK